MTTLPSCTDYVNSVVVSALIQAPQLLNGRPEMSGRIPVHYTGGFCVVFPFNVLGTKKAVRCWHAKVDDAEERTRVIAESLSKVNLPYFVNFEYVKNGIAVNGTLYPVVVMDWVEAKPLKEYISDHIQDSDCLNKLAERFLEMVRCLHENKLSHGDLQHGNVLVKSDGSLVLVDYDSMYVPELDGRTDEICGLAGYQHPARWDNQYLSPKADYFSELVIYTSIKALAARPELWNKLNMGDTETMLFSAEDIKSGGVSAIFAELSTIPSCKYLVSAMKEALAKPTIDSLKPLEEAIVSIVDVLSGLWNQPIEHKSYNPAEVDNITSMW